MANYATAADLVLDILFRCGEPIDGSSDFQNVALTYLNRAYQAIYSGGSEINPEIDEVWWWLRKASPAGSLTLYPLNNGTAPPANPPGTLSASVINGSNGIAFNLAPPNIFPIIVSSINTGAYFWTADVPDVFLVSTIGPASNVFNQQFNQQFQKNPPSVVAYLDAPYTGPTNVNVGCYVAQLEYPLASDVLSVIAPMRSYQTMRDRIRGMELAEMLHEYPMQQMQTDTPAAFAMVGEQVVRFSQAPPLLMKVDYDYLQKPPDLPNDGTLPVVPAPFRRHLADAALMFLFLDKDDTRAQDAGGLAKSGLMAMSKENRRRFARMDPYFGAIRPRQQQITQYNYPIRTSTGLILG